MRDLLLALTIICAMLARPDGVLAVEPSGTFGLVGDFHFDPFEPKGLAEDLRLAPVDDWMVRLASPGERPASRRGSDTNPVLLMSALSAIGNRMAGADFVIVAGDLLSHRFEGDANTASGTPDAPERDGNQSTFAQKTAGFVLSALSQALPGKPIVVALGNNDSDCGDYAIEPDGDFLAGTMEMVRTAVGVDHLARDFEKTYRAGGYYEVQHPTVDNAKILVLNDVLWSRVYQNRCGATGLQEAGKQLEWLRSQLAEQQARRGTVWLVHHIPWGIDAYSTLHSQADRCASGIVSFLRDDISGELFALLRQYAGTITASFSAHTHYDDFRLLMDHSGKPVLIDKMVPAISPIFGQDPGFQVFNYDLARGTPLDYTSYYLANLDVLSSSVTGDWRERYVFSKLYGQSGYSPASVSQVPSELDKPGMARELYYDRRTEVSQAGDYSAYACAIANVELEGYARCHCGPVP